MNKQYEGQRLGLKCPFCNSKKLAKDGKSIVHRQRLQRYLCHNCLRRNYDPRKEK